MQKNQENIFDEIQKKKKELIPRDIKDVFQKAWKNSIKVSWLIIKIYIPFSILAIILKQTGVLEFIAPFFAPLMKLMGLPGDTAVILLSGFVNFFGALGALSAFELTFRQITILGVVVGLAHSLFVETAVLMKLKMATLRIAFFRIIVAFIAGVIMNLCLPKNINGVILNPYVVSEFSWLTTIKSLATTSVQIVIVLFIITLMYELILLWKHAAIIKQKIKFIPNAVGFSDDAFGPWIVGFFIGIAYGAGILFQLAEKNKLAHKDLCLTTIFLILAHAIIEDTMLFVMVGGNLWWIVGTRVMMAFIITRVLSINGLYEIFSWIGLPKSK
jgi:hypothetical protein